MVSAGARAYNRGLNREADEVFVFNTLIFNASATVLHQMM